MKIKITCDSAADLNKDQFEKHNIGVIPFVITMGDKEYRDGIDLNAQMIFDYVDKNKTLPKTSAINAFEYEEFFKDQIDGHDALIHISISSKISSTIENAKTAASGKDNIFVVDSLSLTSGIGLLLLYACELRKSGLTAEDIVKKLKARREHLQVSFITHRLDYLHKGGRCSSVQLLGANLLNIRPSIALKNGKMVMHKKYMGNPTKVRSNYLIDTLAEFNTPDNECVFITYSSATEETLQLFRDYIKTKTNFKTIYEVPASATITSHCGEQTIGILYFNDGDKK